MRAPLLASRCSDPAACCFPSSPPSAREPRLEGVQSKRSLGAMADDAFLETQAIPNVPK
ncbi:Os05g0137800 [Oryza sativa Japonica Group]|uniref:Uncharacterized protein n=5 Tax=Oryza TaxID=4527 RepID=A0A8J8YIV9_ORYSJ|nr:hypothetical protein OsI_18381 [Oryza sativa Indica Group]EEE62257.1 hypothetical protein OsJ_17044 [Oryza sativa Japonica Group]KAB8098024.1 hypothetical protein EE612_026966 [Oryza sativa]BAS92170.1 Os05g0137800 [Oryza sativa Japonica Group]